MHVIPFWHNHCLYFLHFLSLHLQPFLSFSCSFLLMLLSFQNATSTNAIMFCSFLILPPCTYCKVQQCWTWSALWTAFLSFFVEVGMYLTLQRNPWLDKTQKYKNIDAIIWTNVKVQQMQYTLALICRLSYSQSRLIFPCLTVSSNCSVNQ